MILKSLTYTVFFFVDVAMLNSYDVLFFIIFYYVLFWVIILQEPFVRE